MVYNPYGNQTVRVEFEREMKSSITGKSGRSFAVDGRDGDIFIAD